MVNNFDREKALTLLAKMNLSLDALKVEKLIAYVHLLAKWNKAYNLTSVRDINEMWVKHILDSLAVSSHLKGCDFIDVGTGPGLPGMVLAIVNPEKDFTLLDSLGKRIIFLKQVLLELKLENVTIVQSRVENFQSAQFDGVLSRAFASLSDMVSWCKHLPNKQGSFYALKGQYNEQEVIDLQAVYLVENFAKIDLKIPALTGERCLLVFN